MKRVTAISLLLVFAMATVAFGHAGEVHSYMGTVTKLNDDGSFVMKTKEGKTITILTSKDTTYTHADDHAGTRSELIVGRRVVVRIAKDGKTALNVKMTIPKTATK